MTAKHLRQMFLAVGLILLGLTGNAWLASQGEKALLNFPLLHEDRAANALLTLFVASFLLALVSGVGWVHARRYGASWHARIPTVWLEGVNTASWEGTLYQVIIFTVFVLVPFAAMLHLVDILRNAQLCVLDTKTQLSVTKALLQGMPDPGGKQIRVMWTVPDSGCTGGIQVYPAWEFFVLAGLVIVALVIAAAFLLKLLGFGRTQTSLG
jgi:hypothetical protein